jgi:hypothetical protein
MTIIEDLIATAVADVDVLRTMDAQGDRFSTPRSVEFIFTSETESQASAVAGFLAENQYAVTRWEPSQNGYFVEAVVFMPIEQNVLSSVSGFMQCVAKLFAVTYDGWGSMVQREEKSPGA